MAFHKAKALQAAEKSVAQGKIPQAIKQYQDILDNDPSDVSLLNTLGDLHIRERNVTEGLRQFHKLAEAYVREGFNVKAIAIYRKISKVDPNSVDNLLKLAELYQLQGLSREAREQYLQAAEFFKRRNQPDRALEALRKLVHVDPENINFRNRLAAECEQTGKREEAAQCYLESAEILIRRGDQAGAEPALKKAAELDPKNSKIQVLRARVAIACQQPEEAERIINSTPDLQSDPAGRQILLDAYLGSRKLPEAENLAREVFHANPTDFAPVSSLSALLVEEGDIEGAYQLLASLAEPLINQNNAGALLEALRRIWTSAPDHLPTLELIHRLCERTANESALPEVLEALGRVHEQAGDLEKAEAAYLKLVEREPENENYHALLNAVQQKLGRVVKPAEFASKEMALAVEEEPPPGPAGVDADQEVMVKEALENSDLFARYNLPEKAISELEKVLQVYPDQIDVHRRILEISRKGYPERGAAAAAQLARIFSDLGDVETANKYQAIASTDGLLQEIPLPPPPPGMLAHEPPLPSPAFDEGTKAESVMEFPVPAIAPEEHLTANPAATEVSFDLAPPAVQGEPPAAPPQPPELAEPPIELDLTGELEALKAFESEVSTPFAPEPVAAPAVEVPPPVEIPASAEGPALPPVVETAEPSVEAPAVIPEPQPAPEEAISADLEESKIEVEFYLENGFVEEARQAMAEIEEKYPGSPFVAELRQRFDERAAGAPPTQPRAEGPPVDETVIAKPPAESEPANEAQPAEPPTEGAPAEPEVGSLPEPVLMAQEPENEEWELPTSYATPQAVVPPPVTQSEAPASAHQLVIEESVATKNGGAGMLGDLAGDLASSFEGLATPPGTRSAAPAASSMTTAPASPPPAQGVEQLSGLLAEMEESGAAAAAKDDVEVDDAQHVEKPVVRHELLLLGERVEHRDVNKHRDRGQRRQRTPLVVIGSTGDAHRPREDAQQQIRRHREIVVCAQQVGRVQYEDVRSHNQQREEEKHLHQQR